MISVQRMGYVYVINLKKKTYLETGKGQTLLITCLRAAAALQLPTRQTRLAWPFQAHVRVVMRAAGRTIGFGQEGVNPDAWLPEFRLIHRRRRLELMNNEVDLHRRPGCKSASTRSL
jgi:hypothetical protein